MSKKKTDVQMANALLTTYQKFYLDKYGLKPTINRYRDKWGMLDVMQELQFDGTLEAMEYFFRLPMEHTLQQFYSNYDKIVAAKERKAKDDLHRKHLLEKTKRLMEERSES